MEKKLRLGRDKEIFCAYVILEGCAKDSPERKALSKALRSYGSHLKLFAESDTRVSWHIHGCVPTKNPIVDFAFRCPHIKVVWE